ncbi:hypothetical protein EST38_g11339 [Candolleomyces aberdarensis]|uniref:Reverse transcriptase Ty1/copia-type domain-containing protein n=1 Tax=Candolleomyces aberdarensis TaxID=2316362 RepID=A0A4Q2D7U5_9AGAR|nr:hypothetical protein EST38_g11339 [Candolleomyces aberdarensis]
MQYPLDYSAWTFYNPVTKQLIISECAEFDECVFPGPPTKETAPRPAPCPYEHPQHAPSLTPDPLPASPPPAALVVLPEPAPAPQLIPLTVDNWESSHPSPAIATLVVMQKCSTQHWEAAAADAIFTLIANGTWELVELPPGEKAIPLGWVFKNKVAQCPGIDYDDIYSPTFRAATLHTTLAAAGIEDMELCSVDISAAFTNGNLGGSHLHVSA